MDLAESGAHSASAKLTREIYGCALTMDGMLRAAQLLLNEFSLSVDENDDWSEADNALFCMIDGLKLIAERNAKLSETLVEQIGK